MKFTDAEKLILIMLSDIYENTGIQGEIDPDFIKKSIYEEQTWSIPWKYSGIPFESTEPPSIVREVLDILDMWRFIDISYRRLSNDEKVALSQSPGVFSEMPSFSGFDGNNETEYLASAAFIINELDRFQEFKGIDLNSHSPSIEIYKRMLVQFNKERNARIGELLSAEQLSRIFQERIHPSMRK